MSDTNSYARFRWAVCQLDTLGKCRNRAMLRKALATLPLTLDTTYDRILCAIAEEDVSYAIRVLSWLAFSDRPLTVDEVAEVIAIDVARDPAFDPEEVLEDPMEILEICSSLVTIATDDSDRGLESTRQIAVLAHYSVKEYLVSDRIQRGQAARYSMQSAACHSTIAKACLGYLGQFLNPEPMTEDTVSKYKLAQYSAESWMSHAQKAGDRAMETSQAALHLLSRDNAAYLNWIRIYDPDSPWKGYNPKLGTEGIPSPIYYAALCGLGEVAKLLLEEGADVNVEGGRYGNALQAASVKGHKEVVRLLIDNSANVNAQGGQYGHALQAASASGYEKVVGLLLDNGADVNMQGGQYCYSQARVEGVYANALQEASAEGHEKVVRLLLDNGADVNAQSGFYDSALQATSVAGHEAIVGLLVKKGARINALGGAYGNALQAASVEGHKEVVRLLIDNGADVNAQGGHYGYALQAASASGYEKVVRLLIDNGADVNAQDGLYDNALQAALGEMREAVVRLLVEKGADLNALSEEDSNALQAALASGDEAVARLLRDRVRRVS